MTINQFISAIFLIAAFSVSYANATVIKVTYSGSVTFVESNLQDKISVGEKVTGYYIYDYLAAENELDNVSIGRYSVITELGVQVSDYSWIGNSNGSYIQIRNTANDAPFPNEERYSVVDFGVERNHDSQLYLNVFSIFTDAIANSFKIESTELIDYLPFSPDKFTGLMIITSLDSPSFSNNQLNFNISKMNLTQVPAPSAFSLFILCLAILCARKAALLTKKIVIAPENVVFLTRKFS